MLEVKGIKKCYIILWIFLFSVISITLFSFWLYFYIPHNEYTPTNFYINNYTTTIGSCNFQSGSISCFKGFLDMQYQECDNCTYSFCFSEEILYGFNKNLLIDNIAIQYPLYSSVDGWVKNQECKISLYNPIPLLISWIIFLLITLICTSTTLVDSHLISNVRNIFKSAGTSPLVFNDYNPFRVGTDGRTGPRDIPKHVITLSEDEKLAQECMDENLKSVSI